MKASTILTLTSRAQHDLALTPFSYLSCTLTIKLLCLHLRGPFINPGAHQSGSYPPVGPLLYQQYYLSPRMLFLQIFTGIMPLFSSSIFSNATFSLEAYKPPKKKFNCPRILRCFLLTLFFLLTFILLLITF